MAAPTTLMILYSVLILALAEDPNYMIFPDEEGIPHLISLEDYSLTQRENDQLRVDINTIQFVLYTQENPRVGQELKLDDVASINQSNWDPKYPTKLVTHGWRGSGEVPSCLNIRDAYLYVDNYNVIVIDWRQIAKNLNYGKVAKSVPIVAEQVSRFIDFMEEYGSLDPRKIKIVGHSLGAHVAGLAARNTTSIIPEVVGLDPAGPGFVKVEPGNRIDASDADHVQIIHTDNKLGLRINVGDSDFYPNGGHKQPGCEADVFGTCSHSRSYKYFAESIINSHGFRATSTKNYITAFTKSDGEAYMGGPSLDSNARGKYTLKTAADSPYALG